MRGLFKIIMMKTIQQFSLLLLALVLMVACGDTQKPARRGIDYDRLKAELALTPEQSAQFDVVLDKYNQMREAGRPAQGEKVDRIAMFERNEAIAQSQASDMAAFLTNDQQHIYAEFMKKNARKRPGYTAGQMAQMKTDLSLTDEQAAMLDAVNKAFEKAYYDAHDIYHGNAELAKEYWNKFDAERKAALRTVFNEQQYAQYLQLVAQITQPEAEKKN